MSFLTIEWFSLTQEAEQDMQIHNPILSRTKSWIISWMKKIWTWVSKGMSEQGLDGTTVMQIEMVTC